MILILCYKINGLAFKDCGLVIMCCYLGFNQLTERGVKKIAMNKW